MKRIQFSNTNEKIPVIGLGTWGIKDNIDFEYYEQWKKVLTRGIELGMTHIDISESYKPSLIEKIMNEIIAEYSRDDLFITGKLSPWYFRTKNMKRAVSERLKRIGIKYFDLLLVSNSNFLVPIKKYLRLLEDLVNEGKTRYIGVKNFSLNQFTEAQHYLKKFELVNNQLKARIDYPHHIHKVLPYYQKHGITITLYSPLENFNMIGRNLYYQYEIQNIAKLHEGTIQQTSIAWLIDQSDIITLINPLDIKYLGDITKILDLKLNHKEIETFYDLEDEIEYEDSQWI
ncbi:MAG: aldo/keto reductase [Candidatus Thorarchaeota archaeon]